MIAIVLTVDGTDYRLAVARVPVAGDAVHVPDLGLVEVSTVVLVGVRLANSSRPPNAAWFGRKDPDGKVVDAYVVGHRRAP